ncbi:hypothetical protein JRQ81_013151, partial [Phrynocephalus forsythii]
MTGFPCFSDQEPSLKTVLSKVVHEMFLLNNLLNQVEMECHHQERQLNQLKVIYWKNSCTFLKGSPSNVPLSKFQAYTK